jgi:hypothetical protein
MHHRQPEITKRKRIYATPKNAVPGAIATVD